MSYSDDLLMMSDDVGLSRDNCRNQDSCRLAGRVFRVRAVMRGEGFHTNIEGLITGLLMFGDSNSADPEAFH